MRYGLGRLRCGTDRRLRIVGNMRILILCTRYPLEPNDRYMTNELAAALAAAGHHVQVVVTESEAELRMLSLPAGALRMVSAACFAAMYGLCLLAPVVACALGGLAGSQSRSFNDAAMVYCLSGEHAVAVAQANGSLDDPADPTTRHHAGSTAPSGNSAGDAGNIAPCCVSISAAVLTEPRTMSAPSRLASVVVPPPAGALIGHSPERIIRPPIA
jgi:hypothetical protein